MVMAVIPDNSEEEIRNTEIDSWEFKEIKDMNIIIKVKFKKPLEISPREVIK